MIEPRAQTERLMPKRTLLWRPDAGMRPVIMGHGFEQTRHASLKACATPAAISGTN